MSLQKIMFVVALSVVAMIGLGLSAAQAELISPSSISASASSIQNAAKNDPINVVSGGGLTGTNHTNLDGNGWHWGSLMGAGINGQYLTIDLAQDYVIDSSASLLVWNYNNSSGGLSLPSLLRGIRKATFWYAADDGGALLTLTTQPPGTTVFTQLTGVTTDAATGVTFDKANGSATATNYNTVNFSEEVTARYIRIKVDGVGGVGNYGDPQLNGLSEVQVFGSVPTPVIPEPGSIVLLTIGLFGLLAYAWRKRR